MTENMIFMIELYQNYIYFFDYEIKESNNSN